MERGIGPINALARKQDEFVMVVPLEAEE